MPVPFPQTVYDINHNFGEDLVLSGTNDLDTVSDVLRSQQRVYRRLMTSPGSYIWHPSYGAGLGNYVGLANSSTVQDQMQSTIISQILLEPSVSKTPAPQISFENTQSGVLIFISYTESSTQQPTVLSFNLSKQNAITN